MRVLCPVTALGPGVTLGFGPPPGGFTGLFALRVGEELRVYVNACPHLGVPLDMTPDEFLSVDGRLIVCSTHGAEFRLADGFCVSGPCKGRSLEAVEVVLEDGMVCVPDDAGL